jgi:hypothetical protein
MEMEVMGGVKLEMQERRRRTVWFFRSQCSQSGKKNGKNFMLSTV